MSENVKDSIAFVNKIADNIQGRDSASEHAVVKKVRVHAIVYVGTPFLFSGAIVVIVLLAWVSSRAYLNRLVNCYFKATASAADPIASLRSFQEVSSSKPHQKKASETSQMTKMSKVRKLTFKSFCVFFDFSEFPGFDVEIQLAVKFWFSSNFLVPHRIKEK